MANGSGVVPVAMTPREPPKNLREAIEAGDVLAVGSMVRTMSQEEAEVELVAQDRYVDCGACFAVLLLVLG